MKYSIIVPVFNRPDEVDELLESLCQQEVKDFEVIIVEDGSSIPCKDVCDKYAGILDLHYYFKENSGPGQSRNYGAERANGDWLIVLDSDVVLPEDYLHAVDERLKMKNERYDYTCGKEPDSKTDHISHLSSIISSIDAWGGPDASHPSFTPIQKAISYSMTSFFTTGGIRGGKGKKLDKFFPRSYNMGIRREVYQELGGFSKMRFGEDIDFSYRIVEAGYKTALIPEAWVWHKRRTDFRKFFRQVSNSGRARINLEKRHPGTMKLVHLLPTVFTLGVIGLLLCTAILLFLAPCLSLLALSPIILYSLIICIDSSILNKSLWVGVLSIPAAFVQLMGYGLGFIEQWWKRCVLKQPEALPADLSEAERQALEKKFYK
ncbi:glycosyltransferase [Prevotella sp. E13-27]|uniref:glycosyltransferase n=1 Tax=Prevotella sp. E13-27 TaxID=2938122 RepID=UPI00200B5F67|nr:glycosyltransferase [Prevotella sp. E13-27]MCK8621764.1 glycosyltransferase [Prevotella sp. E13-27]